MHSNVSIDSQPETKREYKKYTYTLNARFSYDQSVSLQALCVHYGCSQAALLRWLVDKDYYRQVQEGWTKIE